MRKARKISAVSNKRSMSPRRWKRASQTMCGASAKLSGLSTRKRVRLPKLNPVPPTSEWRVGVSDCR